MAIYNVDGREREYDDYVDPYQPPVAAPPAPVPSPTVVTQPPPTTGGHTPPPYGPGVYMDPNSPPPFAAPSGLTWKFDAANGWYPSGNYGGDNNDVPGPAPDPTGGAFDYGRDPGALPFSPYQEMAPYQPQPYREMEPFQSALPKFSYADYVPGQFTQSSWTDAEAEPGFAEAQSRLSKMIQNTAAYRGILRSGATIGDLGTYLDQNKSQNFQQFDARRYRDFGANEASKFNGWSANRNNAADAWNKNLGVEQYTYDQRMADNAGFNANRISNDQFGYGQAANENDRGNNFRFNTEKASFDDLLSRWTTLVNSATTLARPV